VLSKKNPFLYWISANQRIATSMRDNAIYQMATREHIIVQTTTTNLNWTDPNLNRKTKLALERGSNPTTLLIG